MSLVKVESQFKVGLDVEFGVSVKLHLLHSEEQTIETEIHRVCSGFIELFSPVYLKFNQELEVESAGRSVRARVSSCRSHMSGIYNVAIRTARAFYLRTENRVAVDLVTKLQLIGAPTSLAIRVVDLSPSGLGMELSSPLPPGAKAAVQMGHRTALGEIKHCAGNLHSYRAGLHLENLVRCSDRNAAVWSDLNSGSANQAALNAFIREIEERQLRSVALVSSLSNSKERTPPSKGRR